MSELFHVHAQGCRAILHQAVVYFMYNGLQLFFGGKKENKPSISSFSHLFNLLCFFLVQEENEATISEAPEYQTAKEEVEKATKLL